jgi:inorganic pyrophosphatase
MIQEFFETYKKLEPHRWAKTREWKNAAEAMEIVTYARELYRERIKSPQNQLK